MHIYSYIYSDTQIYTQIYTDIYINPSPNSPCAVSSQSQRHDSTYSPGEISLGICNGDGRVSAGEMDSTAITRVMRPITTHARLPARPLSALHFVLSTSKSNPSKLNKHALLMTRIHAYPDGVHDVHGGRPVPRARPCTATPNHEQIKKQK